MLSPHSKEQSTPLRPHAPHIKQYTNAHAQPKLHQRTRHICAHQGTRRKLITSQKSCQSNNVVSRDSAINRPTQRSSSKKRGRCRLLSCGVHLPCAKRLARRHGEATTGWLPRRRRARPVRTTPLASARSMPFSARPLSQTLPHMTCRRASPSKSLRRGPSGSYAPGAGVPCA